MGKSKKKSKKRTRKRTPVSVARRAEMKSAKRYNKTFGLSRKRGGGAATAVIGVRSAKPRQLRMHTEAGLTMKGGVISGVTEIISNLQLTAATPVGGDFAGAVLFTAALNPLALAPGTRFADMAANYDKFFLEELYFTVGTDVPYTENAIIAGGFESDPADPIPSVGGVIDVLKYMEHSNFHGESLVNKAGISFPKNRKCVKGAKGPMGGFYFNRLPGAATDPGTLASVQQGQIVIFMHTPLQTVTGGGGGGLTYPQNLGPLTMHWRCRFKDAAEKNQFEGQRDYHVGPATQSAQNPFNWTSAVKIQSTISSDSTLQFESGYTSPFINFLLPIGKFCFLLEMPFSASDSAAIAFTAVGTVPGCTLLTGVHAASVPGSTAYPMFTHANYYVTTPGNYNVLQFFGTVGAWAVSGATLSVFPLPEGATALLRHVDYKIRSFAWAKQRAGVNLEDKVSTEVKKELKRLGLEPKDDKEDRLRSFDLQIEKRLCELPLLKKMNQISADALRFEERVQDELNKRRGKIDRELSDIEDLDKTPLYTAHTSEAVSRLKLTKPDGMVWQLVRKPLKPDGPELDASFPVEEAEKNKSVRLANVAQLIEGFSQRVESKKASSLKS